MPEDGIEELGSEKVNHYLLTRQRLAPGAEGRDVVDITRSICALHSTSPLTSYLSIWARMKDFTPTQLEDELYEKKGLARVECMRGTVHCVPTDELPVFFQATSERLQKDFLRLIKDLSAIADPSRAPSRKYPILSLPSDLASFSFDSIRQQIIDIIASQGPLTVSKICELVPELKAKIRYSVGKTYTGAFSLGSRIVKGLCIMGDLIRGRSRGTWRSTLYEYDLMRSWIPGMNLEALEPREARSLLVGKHLAAFGPATEEDISWWARFTKAETRRALTDLGEEVTRIRIEGREDTYLMLHSDYVDLKGVNAGRETSVNLLPSLDPYLMAYRDRSRFLDMEHRDQVFDRSGNAISTVLVDGKVVGVWQEKEDAIAMYLWEKDEEEALTAEARRLADFLGLGGGDPVVSPYPRNMYVKTPFRLGTRG